MWLSSGEWASVPLLDGVRQRPGRRRLAGRRRVTSAFTLGRISFEKSMKPLRGFFDLGLESFLALAAGLAMVKSAGGGGPAGRGRVGSTEHVAGRGMRCGACGDGAQRLKSQRWASTRRRARKSSRHRARISPRRRSVRRVPPARRSSGRSGLVTTPVRGFWTLASASNPARDGRAPIMS